MNKMHLGWESDVIGLAKNKIMASNLLLSFVARGHIFLYKHLSYKYFVQNQVLIAQM